VGIYRGNSQIIRDKVREISKRTVRRPTAQLYVEWTGTYTDPSLEINPIPADSNRVSYPNQTYDGATHNNYKWFFLGDYARLDGSFHPMPDNGNDSNYQVGWRGNIVGNNNGYYSDGSSVLTVKIGERSMATLDVAGDTAIQEYPLIFRVVLYGENSLVLRNETIQQGNPYATLDTAACLWHIDFGELIPGVVKYDIVILQWNKPNTFIKIVEAYNNVESWVTSKEIVSISVLEETDTSDRTLPVGNITCNEIDLTLQNIDNKYSPFNEMSSLHTHIVRNRKIVPYIGFIDDNGDEYLVPRAACWSGDWTTGEQDTGASTSALDRMARLQDIEYIGFKASDGVIADSYSGSGREDAEYTFWLNISAYQLLTRILTYVRTNPDYKMPDFEFDIDTDLETIEIPVAFFGKQSYFDIIKSIAQVTLSYAFMDFPNDDDVANAEARNNMNSMDVLRVRKINTALYDYGMDTDIQISASDYISREQRADSENVINQITTYYTQYPQPQINTKPEYNGDPVPVFKEDEQSIRRMGLMPAEYHENKLIQLDGVAGEINASIIKFFSQPNQAQTLQTLGDPSLRILDRAEIPEYQIFNPRSSPNVTKRGLYAIGRIQTEYDGGLRQTIEFRKLKDISWEDYDTILEVGNATMVIDETALSEVDNNVNEINETGNGTGGI